MVKIKEIQITANYAWSPKANHPVYIVAGTAAQQLDATFSSSASLQLYAIDITDSSLVAKCAGKVDVNDRFQKIIWGSAYADSAETNGIVVCGTDKGGIEIYDPNKILVSDENCLVLCTSKHTGPVRALDFNAFQNNLFASGANDSEIFIWDMKNPGNPMTPGKKSQPLSAISSIAWNRQVQHILASTSTLNSGPCCVVWDLRKNEPIIKVQDPSGRMQCSDAAWHPEVATQLVLASEDDHAPVVQLWDLRFATSPMKILEKHKRGVVSVSWCPQDPDLLLTCGKDNIVYCWNPNSSPPEVVSELDTHAQWCFDVQWCPRNPNIVSSGSFDGHISIHSLMGGDSVVETQSASDKQRNAVAEAFGAGAFSAEQQPSLTTVTKTFGLKKPPKWMRKPCGASFFFGGKLVTFKNSVPDEGQQKSVRRNVVINQVITEDNLVERSTKLRAALVDKTRCSAYCQQKITNAQSAFEEDFWNFMKVNFESEPRQQYLKLLGYNTEELKTKFNAFTGAKVNGDIAAQTENLSVSGKGDVGDGNLSASSSSNALDAFDQIAAANEAVPAKPSTPLPMVIPTRDNDISASLHPTSSGALSRTGRRFSTLSILPGDLDSLISQALLVGDYDSAVELCLQGERMADAIVIASAGGPALLEKTQKRYFALSDAKMIHRLLSAVITKDWNDIVSSCDLNNWKEALASLLTYASSSDLIDYCDKLGERLEADEKLRIRACLCYVCSGNIDKFVRCWDKINAAKDGRNAEAMQDLIEKMMVLLHVVEGRRQDSTLGENASDKLARYASTLAAQGQLSAAMEILPMTCAKKSVQILRDRLFHSQGDTVTGQQAPLFPFHREGVQLGQRPSAQVQPQQYQQQARKPFAQQAAYNQPVSAMQPTSQRQPVSTAAASSYSSLNTMDRAANPYTREPTQRSAYSAPSNLFTPQSQPVTPSVPMQPSGPTHPSSTYQPMSATSVSNGPSLMKPADQTPPPPSPEAYGDGSKSEQRGGWNDPPMLDPSRPVKKKNAPKFLPAENLNIMTPMQPAQVPPNPYQPSGPIHPPHSMPPSGGMMQPLPTQPPVGGPQGPMLGVQPPPMSQGPMLGVVNQQPGASAPGMMQQTQPAASVPSVPTAAPKDVPKAPIPSEHQVLQDNFDGLIAKCQAQAANAQTKRKLEDCSRRLEFLYDKLRANTLSPNILKGLHQVAMSVASRDYATGLRHHTQIVSSSNFSEISAFMPGLKSLLQIAGQLRI